MKYNVTTLTCLVKILNVADINLNSLYELIRIDDVTVTFENRTKTIKCDTVTESDDPRTIVVDSLNEPVKNCGRKQRAFLHCLIVKFDSKISVGGIFSNKVNVKIFRNGLLQITGCKCIESVRVICDSIMNFVTRTINCDKLTYDIIPVMQNSTVKLTRCYDRIRLGTYLSRKIFAENERKFSVMPLTRYMGIKIKFPINDILNQDCEHLRLLYDGTIRIDEGIRRYEYPNCSNSLLPSQMIPFKTYYKVDGKKEKKKNNFVTVCIFCDKGKMIVSGVNDRTIEICLNSLEGFLRDFERTPICSFE